MFHESILQIQEELKYHKNQQEQLEQQLYTLKSYEEFAAQTFNHVQETIEQIQDPKYLELFKESLLSLFPTEKPVYLACVDTHEVLCSSKLEEQERTCEEQERVLEEKVDTVEEEQPKKTYYELTGRPDLRLTTYEDITPDITYSSDGRAYIGFNDRQVAEEFRERLEMPSMLDEAQIMNNHKWEVKFYCDRSYIEELKDDWDEWTPEQKEELDWQEQLVRIAPDIFYDPSTSKCYLGFSNYQRATTYGAHLKEIHELYNSRYTVDKPIVVTNCKHELVIEYITKENARKLAPLNLKKELDHRVNKAVTDTWDTWLIEAQQNEQIPQKEELDFPNPPYKPIPLEEVELCDIVTTSPNAQSAYEVTSNLGTHLLTTCLYNHSLKHRAGQKDFWITEAYLIQKGNKVPMAQLYETRRVAS